MFDTQFWPLTLLLSLIGAGITFGVTSLSRDEKRPVLWAGVSFGVVLVLSRLLMYYLMPSFQGVLFGWWPLVAVTLVPSLAIGLATAEHSGRTWVSTLSAALLLLVVIPIGQIVYSSWGPGNAKRLSDLANIRVATTGETIPPTDPNHMVQVTKDIAAFKGQTALTRANGQNLGSRFKIDPDGYVLQAIKGHRYWVAPLLFTNTQDEFNFGSPFSPGYVYVDAQDPNKEAQVRTDFKITLFRDGMFGLNLYRYLYQAGFTDGELVDAKFEVDDEWNPHWVVSYVTYPFEGVAGEKISKVIVVDVAGTTPSHKAYDLGQEPSWVERALPLSVLKGYVEQWGYYNNSYAHENPWTVWFGFRKDESVKPSEYDLNYTTENHSVWVIPMTSVSGTDHAVTGVVVYETTKNEAVFFPGLRGFNTGNTVRETIEHSPVFLGKNLGVEQVQLYSIYGELTWVAIITNPQSVGRGFAGVALLNAHLQNSSDVIFAPDMHRALGQYANQLATKNSGGIGNVSQGAEAKKISGKVLRISALPGNVQQQTSWVFMIEGDNRTFTATRETYNKIPLVKEGDLVSFTYLEIEGNELAVATFSCPALEKAAAAPEKPTK